jgi:hypothetical protein
MRGEKNWFHRKFARSSCCLVKTNSGSQRQIVLQIGAKDPSSSLHCQKVFEKDGSPQQSQKSTPKTTARLQSVIKSRLKLLTQNFFFVKSIYKCVMDDEAFISRLKAMSGNSKVIMSGRSPSNRGGQVYSQYQVPNEGLIVAVCQ